MKKLIVVLGLVIGLASGGCSFDRTYAPLTQEQAVRAIKVIDERLGAEISRLDAEIHQVREALAMLVQTQMLDAAIANRAQAELMVADYFMARSWASLVEQQDNAKQLLETGQQALAQGIEIVVKAIESEVGRRSF